MLKKICKLYIFIIVFAASSCIYSQQITKREFRGAWIHTIDNKFIKDMSSSQVKNMFIRILDSLKEAGCNSVIFQVRPSADAFYPSKLEPWSRYLTGVQGRAPKPYWDPLAFMIKESHKRGMELEAWCNPYRVTLNEKDTLCRSHVYFRKKGMFVRYGKQILFNPAEPAARRFVTSVIADIVSRYDIDAIHFDDYFYPYPVRGEDFPDDAAFKKYATGQGFSCDQKADWRRYNVELLIKEIHDTIRAIKPWVRFGISPFGVYRNKKDTPDGSGSDTHAFSCYDKLFADVPEWARKGYIDYIAPQLYWRIGHPAADYATLIKWWNKSDFPGQLYIGQSISTFSARDLENPSTTQMAAKMKLERELPYVDGNIWWPGWDICKNVNHIADSLILKYQRYPALVPAYKELDSIPPDAVRSFKKRRHYIRWSTYEKDEHDPMQKARFFAVYCFPKGAPMDISNPKYLLEVTDRHEFDVVKENKNHGAGCRYEVTVIDRCWNESKPSKPLWF
ncbi:MAG: family 10 glycosylhydrolase [Bacteroidales bacterium]|jgi:uncharacterized lipoprotein YddW (UPF0748 family)|nr:family 10 glycosylhydrolase [Bacteroidales bacterium]